MFLKECKFQKAMIKDWFYGELLNEKEVGKTFWQQLVVMLNNDDIPDYLKVAKIILISKNGKKTTALYDMRPI